MDTVESSISFIGHSHDKGFYTVTEEKLKKYTFENLDLKDETTCIGLPPITRKQDRNGFCIFDVDERYMQIIKL